MMGCYISQDVKNITEKIQYGQQKCKELNNLQKDLSDKIQKKKKRKADYKFP